MLFLGETFHDNKRWIYFLIVEFNAWQIWYIPDYKQMNTSKLETAVLQSLKRWKLIFRKLLVFMKIQKSLNRKNHVEPKVSSASYTHKSQGFWRADDVVWNFVIFSSLLQNTGSLNELSLSTGASHYVRWSSLSSSMIFNATFYLFFHLPNGNSSTEVKIW